MSTITNDQLNRRTAIHLLGYACWVACHELAGLTGRNAETIWQETPGSGAGRELMRKRRSEYADHTLDEILELWRAGIDAAFDDLAHAIADSKLTGKGTAKASKRAATIRERYLAMVNRVVDEGGAKFTVNGGRGSIFVASTALPTFDVADFFPA